MSDEKKQGVMDLIYNKINELLGAGDQLFAMQFPAQALNHRRFQYDTSDRNSVLTRPYTVAEAEFRLSDQLFNVSPITQGPNGEKLSIVYKTLINNYLPMLEGLAPFFRDRAGLGRFLLEDSGEKDADGNFMSRMELCKELYHRYLEAKNDWETEKNERFEEFRTRDDMDGYAKWMSSEGQVRQESLNNLYNDVVVRGHLHEVMTILGYLNASSTAEELELAKQRMRHSARLSLDESMTVYPVQFQPSNWFKALTPNFRPEDLTMAKDVIRDQLREKRKELERAKADLRELSLLDVDPAQIQALEKQVQDGKQALIEAESGMIEEYGQSVVMAVKNYFSYTSKGGIVKQITKQTQDVINPTVLKELGLIDDDTPEEAQIAQEAIDSMVDTYKAHQDVLVKAEELSQLRARKIQLESQDMKLQKLRFQQRIEELSEEVDYLSQLVVGVHQEQNRGAELESMTIEQLKDYAAQLVPPVDLTGITGKTNILEKVKARMQPSTGILPKSSEEAELDGMFTDIVIQSKEAQQSSSSSSSSSSSHSSWNVSGWFFSAGGQSSRSSASTEQESHFMSKEFDIGFRVAKVTFDRGGWFNPQLFKMSHAFYRLADLRAGAGLTVDDVQSMNANELKKRLTYEGVGGDTKDASDDKYYALPAYPVAMAIAKDITIKVKMSEEESKTSKSVMEKSSSSGGGFFCFSCSNSSSSKSSSESAFHGQKNDAYYIRIPGPQVIGYFLQLVPKDNSVPYEPMFEEGKESPVVEALQLFETVEKLPAKDFTKLDSMNFESLPTNGNGNGNGNAQTTPETIKP